MNPRDQNPREPDHEALRQTKRRLVAACLDTQIARFGPPERAPSWAALVDGDGTPTTADMTHIRRLLGMVAATLRSASAVASGDGPSLAEVFARVDQLGGAAETPAAPRALRLLGDDAGPEEARALARAVHLYRSLQERGDLQGEHLMWEMEAAIDSLPALSELARAVHDLAKAMLRVDFDYLLAPEVG